MFGAVRTWVFAVHFLHDFSLMNRRLVSHALPLLLLPVACSPDTGSATGGSDSPHLVANGKADNYYSDVAAEFELTGTVAVEMTQAEFDDELVRMELVNRRITAVGLYLTGYVTDKFEGIDRNDDGEISDDEVFFRNVGWGDFQGMVRNLTVAPEDVYQDADGNTHVTFSLDMAGPPTLLSLIPPAEDPGFGPFVFEFAMPAGKSVDPNEVPRGEFRSFNPETYEGEIELVRMEVRPLPKVGNAYPQYAAFAQDGLFDISLFYGYDYNTERWDIREAEEAFSFLQRKGFETPVPEFDLLTADSGPFTKTLYFGGQATRVEVYIYHADMFEGARDFQHDLALQELTSRDVFFYNGHAGPYYGFYLDEEKLAQVDYAEFATAAFETDRQQFVVAQGCQTYSQYADMMYANPAKSEDNLDVITTVNYSYGQGTTDLLWDLIKHDAQDAHQPTDFYEIVRRLNQSWINRSKQVFYGVMGIDGNSQLHPYAQPDRIGDLCAQTSDCGDPAGNVCVASFDGTERCAAIAVGESDCPAGTNFGNLGQGNVLTNTVCFAP